MIPQHWKQSEATCVLEVVRDSPKTQRRFDGKEALFFIPSAHRFLFSLTKLQESHPLSSLSLGLEQHRNDGSRKCWAQGSGEDGV